jgi:hypothetical protein
MLISIFTLEYFAEKLVLIHKYFVLVPELIAVLIALVIIGRSITLRRWEQPPHYLWLLVAIILVCMIGVVAEAVAPGPLVLGIRNYFKFFPLLLLPAVFRFSDRQIGIILGIFFLLAVLQVPLAFFQRFVQFGDAMHTGDPIAGSVKSSSSLSMILCMAIALVMTLYVHGKIALSLAATLFCFLAAPTAINETKATLFLLPIATLGPFFLARDVEKKWRKITPVLMLCAGGLVAFAIAYNFFIEMRWRGTALDQFFLTDHWESYLYRGSDPQGSANTIGRVDSILIPLNLLADEWMQLLFGLGIGNVSNSFLPGMMGEYAELAKDNGFGQTVIGNLIWETGIVGLSLYLLFFFFVWRDARRFSASGGEVRWYGTWWSTCTVILIFGLIYKSILNFNEMAFMLFFWTGTIASRLWLLQNTSDATETSRPAPRLQLAGHSP